MENRTRNKQLNLKLTKEELDYFNRKKELSKVKNSTDFLLRSISNANIFYVDTQPLISVAYEINKIGVNVNQIAKVANTYNSIYKDDIRYMQEQISAIEEMLKEVFLRSGKISANTPVLLFTK